MNIKTPNAAATDSDWRNPDGRQMVTDIAMKQLGMTPGDAGELWAQMSKNSAMMAGGATKAAQTMERHGEKADWTPIDYGNDHDNKAAQTLKSEEDKRFEEKQRQDAQFLQEKRDQQLAFEEKQRQDEAAAKNHPAGDARNDQILSGMRGLLGFGVTLGLTTQAVGAFGAVMSPQVATLGDQVAVISNGTGNNFGSLLAQGRELAGVGTPAMQDTAVLGPNNTVPFTPGEDPNPAPGAIAGPANTLQQRAVPGAVPGLSGPSIRA